MMKRLEDAALWAAGLALLAMGLIVAGSVLGRTLFNAPVPDDLLMVGLLMVCVIVLPLAYIERNDGHIVVTILSDQLPRRVQAFLKAIGSFLLLAFFGTMGVMLARKVPGEFAEGLYYDGELYIPTWPMKAVFALGVAVLTLRLIVSIAGNLCEAVGARSPASGSEEAKD